ncbi:hypothetical protein J2Z21_000999 [Streptomyces griseochromogenes]|uniref:Uncharacterized protein n=1 Tax=Streptomyces griseochromogenes TaxID=68214 RepID=A0ABS4LKZ9_9ACTN|nr:hypothetical protein [Streptomyces griseochromogenes]
MARHMETISGLQGLGVKNRLYVLGATQASSPSWCGRGCRTRARACAPTSAWNASARADG